MRWFTVLLVAMWGTITAQDLSHINLTKPDVYLDGNISGGIRSFSSSRALAYRNSDFGYLASARLTLHVHGLSLPFSYRVGDQLSLPNLPSFKYWGLSPKYKSVQLHIGHRSLRFSDHTLAGIQTYGLGATVKTRKLSIQFSRGTLDQQRPERVVYNSVVQARKEKKYTAASVRIGSSKNHIHYAVLSSREQEYDRDTTPVRYNLVNELAAKKQLGSMFFIATNVAVSYTDEEIDDFFELDNSVSSLAVNSAELLGVNAGTSSKVGLLYGGSVGINGKKVALSLDFDHVDRTFETFGRTFQITDVRTYTIKNRLQLFGSNLLVNSRVGLQQNNLNDDKASNSTRWITNFNVVTRSTEGHTVSANISNFNLEKENLYVVGQDSFSFSFNALTVGVSPQFVIGESRLVGNFIFTRNSNEREDAEVSQDQQLLLGTVMYEVPVSGKNVVLQLGANYSKLTADAISEKLIGFTVGTQFLWNDKLRLDIRYNPNRNSTEQEDSYLTRVAQLQGNYAFSKNQNVFVSAYYQNVGGLNAIRENQIRLGYKLKFTSRKNISSN